VTETQAWILLGEVRCDEALADLRRRLNQFTPPDGTPITKG
jgi:hypothetical protein